MSQAVVLILAGGKGERFWPRSTESRPKQLHKVYSDLTLLEETIARARLLVPKNRIFIGCNPQLKKSILATHKGLKSENFILEPVGRNTAPIVALAALELEERFPGATHVVLSADHYISPPEEFQATLKRAIAAAASGQLVTLGIRPSRPETGYGYIRKGKEIDSASRLCAIESFVEKPDLKRALSYLKNKSYYWNSGIFIWRGSDILAEFAEHAPYISEPLSTARSAAARRKLFPQLPSEPVDTAILEKSKRVAMVEASFTWDDVGSWLALERILRQDIDGNVVLSEAKGGEVVGLESSGNIVVTQKKLVALLGVQDLILVEEGDRLFVTTRQGIGKIKEMLSQFRENRSLQKFL